MGLHRDFLSLNKYSRPGTVREKTWALIYHWVANPMTTPKQNRDFFELRKDGKHGYGSAHFIIGNGGEVLQCLPVEEVAYHVGSSQPDPESGKIYTDWARSKFGEYALLPEKTSPNECTVGVELCHLDWEGTFTKECLLAARDLGVQLCKQLGLDPSTDIGTHHKVVGWKDCPRLWTRKPELFEDFTQSVVKGWKG